MNDIKTIAIHLPQFHPIPENDEWWGKGFTEWNNVVKATPKFENHYQPHLPSDLGFYDLRLEESRLSQETLAKEYGIHGFCYYHYWFNGKRLLNEPIDRKLKNLNEDLPFMLCWANENWTRRWDGQEQEILIKQNYSEKDDLEHIQFLCSHFFTDERYIKIDKKPVLIIYKVNLIPNIEKLVKLWKDIVIKNGFPDLFLICMDNFVDIKYLNLFDKSILFHPDFRIFPKNITGGLWNRLLNKLNLKKSIFHQNLILDYINYVNNDLKRLEDINSNKVFLGATPGWDNSARRKKNATIFINNDTSIFEKWLLEIKIKLLKDNKVQHFVFINAWNEWAEGNHLEPCQKNGKSYLEIIKKIFKN